MKIKLSGLAIIAIMLTLLAFRTGNTDKFMHERLNVTKWDAFGYYMYAPSLIIYHDYKKLEWLDTIDRKYDVTGGDGWQAHKADNGNYVFKYLGGVSLMQLPFFLIGHGVASRSSDYPADGFSAPYQYAIAFGALIYAFLGLLVLKKVLLRYFSDQVTAITLLLVCIATNFIEYAAVDGGLSHIYIFFLYAAVLYTTMRWHEQPSVWWAFLTGYIIGLATMSRPTEAVMLFIPLMWGMPDKAAAKAKWALVKKYKVHVAIIIAGGFIGILPQLLYWKLSSGGFIYDVGSKWVFLNPYFRVLFGWEKGWFIYTPATILFVAGLFFVREFPFRKSVLWFCLLNIWIIIAWDDWRYGGTFATRALVQSYPVFALPVAALTKRIINTRWKGLFYAAGIYLSAVNLFQTWQFGTTILHYNDMNRLYYSHIYLNPDPSPLDMSLLDTDELITNENKYRKSVLVNQESIPVNGRDLIPITEVPLVIEPVETWLRVDAGIKTNDTRWKVELGAAIQSGDSVKTTQVRLFNPVGKKTGRYAFYIKVPATFKQAQLKIYLLSPVATFSADVHELQVTRYERK